MKLYRVFLIASLISTFAVLGCGDSGSGGSGQSADEVCSGCVNDVVRGACVTEYNRCVDANPNDAECPAGAQALCGL
jgi:hypothetical protein